MKFLARHFLVAVTIALWIGVAGLVAWGNGFFGNAITMTWRNPARPSAVFSWNQAPTKQVTFPIGLALLVRGERYTFSVRLPRAYRQGTMRLRFEDPQTTYTVSGQRRDGTEDRREYRAPTDIPLTWAEYQADGRTYDFTLTATARFHFNVESVLQQMTLTLQP